jgi:hypothetical protein
LRIRERAGEEAGMSGMLLFALGFFVVIIIGGIVALTSST